MPDGSLVSVRCGASNRCSYCAMFAALEAALVIKLDAQIRAPTVGLTTTTREPDFDLKRLRRAEQNLWRALRRDFSPLDYIGFLEWTTGKGTNSGGHRRPHIHHLVKGIPADDPRLTPLVDEQGRVYNELEREVARLWERYTGDAYVVDVRPLRTAAGAIAYLALHHHKREQAPPPGFAGRRLRPSRKGKDSNGYYEQPIAELRELAQQLAGQERVALVVKRAVRVHLEHRDDEDEFELDGTLNRAIAEGLRDLAEHPPEFQRDLFTGEVDYHDDRCELLKRIAAAVERIRRQEPPELVRVREKERWDPISGITIRVATSIIGPLPVRAAA